MPFAGLHSAPSLLHYKTMDADTETLQQHGMEVKTNNGKSHYVCNLSNCGLCKSLPTLKAAKKHIKNKPHRDHYLRQLGLEPINHERCICKQCFLVLDNTDNHKLKRHIASNRHRNSQIAVTTSDMATIIEALILAKDYTHSDGDLAQYILPAKTVGVHSALRMEQILDYTLPWIETDPEAVSAEIHSRCVAIYHRIHQNRDDLLRIWTALHTDPEQRLHKYGFSQARLLLFVQGLYVPRDVPEDWPAVFETMTDVVNSLHRSDSKVLHDLLRSRPGYAFELAHRRGVKLPLKDTLFNRIRLQELHSEREAFVQAYQSQTIDAYVLNSLKYAIQMYALFVSQPAGSEQDMRPYLRESVPIFEDVSLQRVNDMLRQHVAHGQLMEIFYRFGDRKRRDEYRATLLRDFEQARQRLAPDQFKAAWKCITSYFVKK